MDRKRSTFSGKLGFVLSAAGASVGLGNIWRFPYLAAKYGGGIFLLIYVILALTFGYTMIVAETSIGRASGKSPVGAFRAFSDSRIMHAGGWLNAVISILIVPYYSVIGGWVLRYLFAFAHEDMNLIAQESFFTSFLAEGWTGEFWFLVFSAATLGVIILGVKNGIEKVSGIMMP
ncbi:MAG: sodium-dependent transporter, partial [Solobacterium sp.]|nr:sodium-dependent transporter [Solobacterium sp.]